MRMGSGQSSGLWPKGWAVAVDVREDAGDMPGAWSS